MSDLIHRVDSLFKNNTSLNTKWSQVSLEDYESGDRAAVIQRVVSFYHCEECPWSNQKTGQQCEAALEGLKVTNEDVLEYAEVLRQDCTTLSRLNVGSQVSRRGNRQRALITPLMGTSFGKVVGEREEFVSGMFKRVGGLKWVLDKVGANDAWPVVFPLTMAFLEDSRVEVKAEGCLLTQALISRCKDILLRSRVEPLIFDAIIPVLLALPSLTPSKMAAKVVPVGYDTVFMLWQATGDLPNRLSGLYDEYVRPSLVKIDTDSELVIMFMGVIEHMLDLAGDYVLVLRKPVLYGILDVIGEPFLNEAAIERCIEVLEKLTIPSSSRFDVAAVILRLQKRHSAVGKSLLERLDLD